MFNCSAIFQDQPLNKHLLQGPDVINRLIDVPCDLEYSEPQKHVALKRCLIVFMQIESTETYWDFRGFKITIWMETLNIARLPICLGSLALCQSPAVASINCWKWSRQFRAGTCKLSEEQLLSRRWINVLLVHLKMLLTAPVKGNACIRQFWLTQFY